MPEQLIISDPPCAEPERRSQAWRTAVWVAVLAVCVGITIVFLVAIVSPSAGAAGGCGGG
jgi:hypothetical protein